MEFRKNLGAIQVLETSTDSVRVTLTPLATVKAKLVDSTGKAAASVTARFFNHAITRIHGPRGHGAIISKSDKDGHFTQKMVAGHYRYKIYGHDGPVKGEIQLEPGQTLNLGTINMDQSEETESMAKPRSNQSPLEKDDAAGKNSRPPFDQRSR